MSSLEYKICNPIPSLYVNLEPSLYGAPGFHWAISEDGLTWKGGLQNSKRFFPCDRGCKAPSIIKSWIEFKALPMYAKDGL